MTEPMLTPQLKGTALEIAVHAIESMILRESASYSEKTFSFDLKKIVTVGGVRHEIDIWVSVDLGDGYTALFISECKNWADKVGKNEIIVLAEKIDAVQAQRGFFFAKSFTNDAEAQEACPAPWDPKGSPRATEEDPVPPRTRRHPGPQGCPQRRQGDLEPGEVRSCAAQRSQGWTPPQATRARSHGTVTPPDR